LKVLSKVVWRFIDGKPGHENQSLGLLNALDRRLAVDAYTLPAVSPGGAVINGLFGSFPAGSGLPDPDIIMGAGHATHIPMLSARRARGGRVVVLMKPGLPLKWFDLCVIPEHDGVRLAANVLITRGALNTVTPDKTSKKQGGLFLIGGPSKHFGWSDEDIGSQVLTIVDKEPYDKWILSTSRRTPDSFMQAIKFLRAKNNLTIVPCQETSAGWVADHLAATQRVWVTKDSVSMVYEALTSGAAVGLLNVPQHESGRVARGVVQLIADGLVTTFKAWRGGEVLATSTREFNEAARCADEICRRWFGVVKT